MVRKVNIALKIPSHFSIKCLFAGMVFLFLFSASTYMVWSSSSGEMISKNLVKGKKP